MFECAMCGKCCQNLHYSDIYADLDRGDVVCKFLQNNLCSIYEIRPLKCRIDDSYELIFKGKISKEVYYKLNYEVCEKMKKEM